ncbi:MAG: glycosyltransferase [Geminicoccaceae bacterium]
MNNSGQLICLNMIVKNEARVIRRCLDSVRPIIDRWIIVDTGSTDGTQDIIREHMRDLPGELHERTWRDFAHNRSEALDLARGQCDYTLIIDADDTLEISRDTGPLSLTADSYMVTINDTGFVYQRPQLMRSALPWRYEGVLHEYLTCDEAGPVEELPGIEIRLNQDGARRNDPNTYKRDAAVLEVALRTETNPFLLARYRFYVAQSYRDCHEPEKALASYLARAELGYWQEEVFVSLYCAAQLKEQLGYPEHEVIDAYIRATDAQPARIEALYKASRFCRQRKRYEEGYQLAKRGLSVPMPPDALFVEPWIYEIGLLEEFSLNAYWSGHDWDCLDASLKMLATTKLRPVDTERILANARFASDRLAREPRLGPTGAESFTEQHSLAPPLQLRSRVEGSPRVLVRIVASQREAFLPLFLECIEALDYPKSAMVLSVRVYNSTDATERLLRDWLARIGDLYAAVEIESDEENIRDSEWYPSRSRIFGHMRDVSLHRPADHKCDFLFVVDVDNFIRPSTLRELVALDLPIAAPFLRSIQMNDGYSNYHADVEINGYFKECDQYAWILNRRIRGVLSVPVVKCTYLVRSDVLGELTYEDSTARHEYVIMSERARERGVPQYLDNRQVYGYIVQEMGDHFLDAAEIERARRLLSSDLEGDLRSSVAMASAERVTASPGPGL